MANEMEHQVRAISGYVEREAQDETVEHAERLIGTKVMGREHEVWDVRTDNDRYWVVTNPTNLYSQDEFKSADYALTFHLGILARLAERDRVEVDEDRQRHVRVAWRKYEQAVDTYNRADEAEAYQSVGIHCREALIACARHIAAGFPEEPDLVRPKTSDFKSWAALGAEHFATGRLRSYLVTVCEKTWDLSVWLQHYVDATPWDAELVLDATAHTVSMVGLALLRHEKGAPERCPRCDSYRVEWDGGLVEDTGDLQWKEQVCGACEYRWSLHQIRWRSGEGWIVVDEGEAS